MRVGLNRRTFARILGGALIAGGTVAHRKLKAYIEAPWSIFVEPDIQYQVWAPNSPLLLTALRNWEVANQNLSVGGIAINAKSVHSLGDCVNWNDPTVYSAQGLLTGTAAGILTSNHIPFQPLCGNHDYPGSGNAFGRGKDASNRTNNSNLDQVFKGTNPFGPSNLVSLYGGNGMTIKGSTDTFRWGGAYTEPDGSQTGGNCYYFLTVGFRKVLCISLELYPRSAVMAWAKSIHDANLDCECWIFTHGFAQPDGTLCTRAQGVNLYDNGGTDSLGNSGTNGGLPIALSTSSQGMWDGTDYADGGFTPLCYWSNVTLVANGHYTGPLGYGTGWWYHANQVASSSWRQQNVLQLFMNLQDLDYNLACGGSPLDGTSDVGHVGILRFRPDQPGRQVEMFGLSVNRFAGGNCWMDSRANTPTNPSTNPCQFSNPRQLFSYPAPWVGAPGPAGRR
jgi:hypothetical protein